MTRFTPMVNKKGAIAQMVIAPLKAIYIVANLLHLNNLTA